jgi:hypothetical protein
MNNATEWSVERNTPDQQQRRKVSRSSACGVRYCLNNRPCLFRQTLHLCISDYHVQFITKINVYMVAHLSCVCNSPDVDASSPCVNALP